MSLVLNKKIDCLSQENLYSQFHYKTFVSSLHFFLKQIKYSVVFFLFYVDTY